MRVNSVEIKGGYEDFSDGHETALEAELSYGINEHIRLGLNVPSEWEEDDSSFGDVGAFLEFVVNPESDGIVVGGELKLTAPTGEDSEGMGGEAQLRFSKYFAEGRARSAPDVEGILRERGRRRGLRNIRRR